ncbi:hypothetical protein AC1031_003017 [Aphanomyces cochlioides]|nr:hypothetical protein AC1031_003017 [Aphanomyces cochlioides]
MRTGSKHASLGDHHRLSQSYYKSHCITRYAANKKTYWSISSFPDSKFCSLEALVYSWYNVSSIDADCLANLTKPLHLTNPPFPPTTVANTMFGDIGNLDMEAVGGRCKTFMRYEADEGEYFLVKHMPDRVNLLSNQVEIIYKGRNYDLKGNLAKKELNKYPELKKRPIVFAVEV